MEITFQLYTTHAQNQESIFFLFFCLLPNKTEATYTRTFRETVNQINQQGNNLREILVDSERKAIKAIQNSFKVMK